MTAPRSAMTSSSCPSRIRSRVTNWITANQVTYRPHSRPRHLTIEYQSTSTHKPPPHPHTHTHTHTQTPTPTMSIIRSQFLSLSRSTSRAAFSTSVKVASSTSHKHGGDPKVSPERERERGKRRDQSLLEFAPVEAGRERDCDIPLKRLSTWDNS
jgi:hypothetical protein